MARAIMRIEPGRHSHAHNASWANGLPAEGEDGRLDVRNRRKKRLIAPDYPVNHTEQRSLVRF